MLLEFFNELKKQLHGSMSNKNVLLMITLGVLKLNITPSQIGKNQIWFLLGVKYNLLNFFLKDSLLEKKVNNLLLDFNEWQQLPLMAKGRESNKGALIYHEIFAGGKNHVVLLT